MLLIYFTCHFRGQLLTAVLPVVLDVHRAAEGQFWTFTSVQKASHMGSSVPARCWDQQPTDIVGFSPIASSSIMFFV